MIGSHIVQSVAGAPQAARTQLRDRARKVEGEDKPGARDEDQVDVPVAPVTEADPVRKAGANGEEESREDREAAGFYTPHAREAAKRRKGENIDLKA
ncbi:MAG: hypothetical protein KF684_03920 [Phycisphaeraceae bacterium]|nr:hypothetical protein [Phycisphaeraceae bacterium]